MIHVGYVIGVLLDLALLFLNAQAYSTNHQPLSIGIAMLSAIGACVVAFFWGRVAELEAK